MQGGLWRGFIVNVARLMLLKKCLQCRKCWWSVRHRRLRNICCNPPPPPHTQKMHYHLTRQSVTRSGGEWTFSFSDKVLCSDPVAPPRTFWRRLPPPSAPTPHIISRRETRPPSAPLSWPPPTSFRIQKEEVFNQKFFFGFVRHSGSCLNLANLRTF